jgi:alpha-tubulin suppressor-like RCC1 family protein
VIGLSGAVALAAGSQHTCAVLADGTARCWGLNLYGAVGDGARTIGTTPGPVLCGP